MQLSCLTKLCSPKCPPKEEAMDYLNTLYVVNTVKALEFLKLESDQQGAYVYFKCQHCGGKAVAKAYGFKKNLTYCTSCKKSGHIISLAQDILKLDYQDAKKFLKQAIVMTDKRLTEECQKKYDLKYHPVLKEWGIDEHAATILEIGVPEGRSMMAGCLTFAVRNEKGTLIAYWGLNLKTGKEKYHRSFSPELYVYNIANVVDKFDRVVFTDDMIEWLKLTQQNVQAVCNFNLPYLSPVHLELLRDIKHLEFKVKEPREFALQAIDLKTYYKFHQEAA